MCHGTIYLLKLCITFQLDHCTYVELHDIIRISGSQISIANSSREKKQHFCQELIQKEHECSLRKRRGGTRGKIPKGGWGSMTYRVWVGINKHESHWGLWGKKEKDDTHMCSQGKEGGHAKEERSRREAKYPEEEEEAAQKCNRTRSEPLDSSF